MHAGRARGARGVPQSVVIHTVPGSGSRAVRVRKLLMGLHRAALGTATATDRMGQSQGQSEPRAEWRLHGDN